MDGNLLDSDTTDTTLAKDWSLPELPEGVQNKSYWLHLVLFSAHPLILDASNGIHVDLVKCFNIFCPGAAVLAVGVKHKGQNSMFTANLAKLQ